MPTLGQIREAKDHAASLLLIFAPACTETDVDRLVLIAEAFAEDRPPMLSAEMVDAHNVIAPDVSGGARAAAWQAFRAVIELDRTDDAR